MSVSKTDLKNLAEEKELTYTVNIVVSRTLKWKDIFDEVQEYLLGEHGSPTMQDIHRDLDCNLVFTDCDGDKFGLDGLVDWHVELFEEGKFKEDIHPWNVLFDQLDCLSNYFDSAVAVEISTKDESLDLKGKSVPELKEMAKSAGIKGISTMKKYELVEALKSKFMLNKIK